MAHETDVFLGPETGEGASAVVVDGKDTKDSDFYDHYIVFHLSGIEDISSRPPEVVGEDFGGYVYVEFTNGKTIQLNGSIKTVNC